LAARSDCRSGQDESLLTAIHPASFCLPSSVRLPILAGALSVLNRARQ
jgi:hypothetical protein